MSKPGRVWLTYFRSEHRGVVVLFAISLFLVVLPRAFHYFKSTEKIDWRFDTLQAVQMMKDHQNFQDSLFDNKNQKHFYYGSKKQLLAMGFTEEAAERIDQARKKGKRFQSYADLTSETGLDSTYLARIISPKLFRKETNDSKEPNIVHLNYADTIELKTLPGIGSKTAKRIINYRDKLGGFTQPEQLLEIWYVDTVAIRKLFQYFEIDKTAITKLTINSLPENHMAMHPYISKNQAKIIATYTRQNGNITREQFLKMPGFTEKERLKLLPYLSFD